MDEMLYFDAHTHGENYGSEAEAVRYLDRAREERVGVVMVSADAASYEYALSLSRGRSNAAVFFGIHPWNAHNYADKTDSFEAYIRDAAGVGEIGLDGRWSREDMRHLQRDVFLSQLYLAKKYDKPVSVHTTGREEETLSLIRESGHSRVCIHWYSGEAAVLKEYIDLGWFFTLGPDIGFKGHALSIAQMIPKNRILMETDGSKSISWGRGTKEEPWHNTPGALIDIYRHGAKSLGVDFDEFCETVKSNFKGFLSGDA